MNKNINNSVAENLCLEYEMETGDKIVTEPEILLSDRKYSFIVEYTSFERKEALMDKLKELNCIVESELDFAKCICVNMTMVQLAEIKKCNFVNSVERNFDYSLLSMTGNPDKEIFLEFLAGEPPVRQMSKDTLLIKDSNSEKTTNSETRKTELLRGIENAYNKNWKGQKIKVAILDTGIAEHSDLSISGGVSFVGDKIFYKDTNGHGTQMAGIISASGKNNDTIKGVAPSSQIYAVKIFDKNGFATTATIMAGINWAIENKMNIINMGFGTYHKSNLLEKMVNTAAEKGVILVGAVGNDGGFKDENRIMYPAAFDNVIAVGSGSANRISTFTNKSKGLDFVAPGRANSTNIDNEYINAVGTSVSASYVTGMLAVLWSARPYHSAEKILNVAKGSGIVEEDMKDCVNFGEIDMEVALTNIDTYDKISSDKSEEYSGVAYNVMTEQETLSAGIVKSADVPIEKAAVEYYSNDMGSAINLPFINWKSGNINCPGDEVWYTFTANVSSVHPNGSRGWYTVHTRGLLDTIGYLYDSSGNLIAYNDDHDGNTSFSIWAQLTYGHTYYIRVKAYGNNTGSFDIRVSYHSDDHGNTYTSATNVVDVYSEDKSISGYLHGQNDVDYYTFALPRDCVVEIYTEGNTDTYGTLYGECECYLTSNSDGNGNGNFKITYHFEGMKQYYIAVRHNSPTGYGDYTLKFKFVKDYSNQIVDEQYRVMYWYADDQDAIPEMNHSYTRSLAFISNTAKSEFYTRIIKDIGNNKTGLREVLESGILQDIANFLLSTLLSSIPLIGDTLSVVWDVGTMTYNYMDSLDALVYEQRFEEIENTNQYIVGQHYYFYSLNPLVTGNYKTYSVSSGTYYGATYQRGKFVEVFLKHP